MANIKLKEIQKGLSDELKTKQMVFPKFFFLSNNKLLEILLQTKDPCVVQPHLNKAFEGVCKVTLKDNLKIMQIISTEGKTINLRKLVDLQSTGNCDNVKR